MSNYILKNENLTVTISDLGAEVISIINKAGKEIIHQGCEVYPSHCPICFPIIGNFPNDIYNVNGIDYMLNIHGFAKFAEFSANRISETEMSFTTISTPKTLESYPFKFKLTVNYKISGNDFITEYATENKGDDTMYYSIGTHTGYKLDKGLSGYKIRFEKPQNNDELKLLPVHYAFSKDELIKEGIIELNDSLFERGCFTLGGVDTKIFVLEENNGKKIADIDFSQFDYITVWSAPKQKYVCIEPWTCESAHYTDTNRLDKQRDITELNPGMTKKHKHIYTVY